jgi:hypothetical protein
MMISHALLSTNSFLLVDAVARRFKTRLITEISGLNFICPKLFLAVLLNTLIFLGFPYTSKKYLNGIRKCIFAPISFLLKMLKKFSDKQTSELNIDIHVKKNIEHINKVFNNKIVKYTYLMNDTDYTFKKDLNPSILNNNILLFKSLIFYSSTTELNTSFMYYIFKIFSTYKNYLIFCTLDYIKSDDDDYKNHLNNFLINESINIIKDKNLFTIINNLKNTIIDFELNFEFTMEWQIFSISITMSKIKWFNYKFHKLTQI